MNSPALLSTSALLHVTEGGKHLSFSPYVVQGIFLLTGIISLLAALFNWDWFFNARNTLFIVNGIGRRRARWFYGITGVVLIGMSVLFWYQTSNIISTSRQ